MNNSWIKFDPLLPIWIVVVIMILIFSFIFWKEIKRKQGLLAARLIAQLLVAISVLGIILRPSYYEEIKSSSIILLTPGFSSIKVDSLIKNSQHSRIVRTKDSEQYPGAEELPSYQALTDIGKDIQFIFGEGLPSDALELFKQKNFKFVRRELPVGITDLVIPETMMVNQRSKIQGSVKLKRHSKIVLTGPGGAEDSLSLKPGINSFALSILPRQTGKFLYSININNDSSVIDEKLPLTIVPERKLTILFLQKFPSAEVRTLKNYLSDKGHSLAIRYQTSKNNFKYEYANTKPVTINQISSVLLDSFDLVFVDSDVLKELPLQEQKALQNAVKDGLGLIVMMNEIPTNNALFQFLPVTFKRWTLDTVHIRFSTKTYVLPVLPVEALPSPTLEVVSSKEDRILSGYVSQGMGKAAFQLMGETYRIYLEGNADDYGTAWTSIIDRISRNQSEPFKMKIRNTFPYVENESMNVDVISTGEKPVLYADSIQLPLTEDLMIDDYWHGRTWASSSGWHQFTVQDSTQLNYFVSQKGDWKTLRMASQLKMNTWLSSTGKSQPVVGIQQLTAVPTLVFFLLFILACGFLWLAPKL